MKEMNHDLDLITTKNTFCHFFIKCLWCNPYFFCHFCLRKPLFSNDPAQLVSPNHFITSVSF